MQSPPSRDLCLRSVAKAAKNLPVDDFVVREYLADCEGLGGEGYWQRFATLEDVAEDFRRYLYFSYDV